MISNLSQTNVITPVTTDRSISYRNGASITYREWDDQWKRDTRPTEDDASDNRIDTQTTESSDYPTITNSLTSFDFLGRSVSTVTPLGIASNLYDGVSTQVLTSTRSGQPPVYNLYNVLGEPVGAVVSGITNSTDVSYETISGEIWRVTDSLAGAVHSVTREQLTGLSDMLRRHTVAIGANGVTNEVSAVWDNTAKTLTETHTSSLRATPSVRVTKYGRTIAETSVDGERNFFFDPYGRVFYTERRPSGASTWFSEFWLGFNDFGDVLEHDTFIGSGSTYAITSYTFDAFGRTLTATDALGNVTTNTYDALGQRINTFGATYPVNYSYDTMGRMKELSTTRDDATWDTTQWHYDHATGLATNKVYADASRIAYTYTDDGKPLRTTWARGAWREQAYNADGLPSATAYSDATPSVSFGYDAFQHLASASNAVAAFTYANDNLGAATNETITITGTTNVLARHKDIYGRVSSLTVAGLGEAGTPPYYLAYAFDSESRLDTVSNSVFTATYAYTPDGWDSGYTISLTNGIGLTRALTRDLYRRGLIKTVTNSVDNVAVNPLAYSYDLLNRAIGRNTDSFGYNARSEVASASILSNAYTFAYDFIGNHTASSVNSVETIYAANNLNQYTSILCAPAPLREPSYDLDGNMTANGAWSYTYDAENRLVSAYSNSVYVVSNAYDYMSRRVVKWTPSRTTTFVYDGWNLIQDTVATASGTTTNHYVWGKDLSGTIQGAGGVGGLLAVKQGNAWYFPLADANGNITAYVDEQGTFVAEYTYDAFGRTIAQSGSMANVFSFRFSTKYFDTETGLYYYGMRFYSPNLRRWLNRDPIEEKGGVNVYGFCANDGVNGFDPWGMKWVIKREGKPYAIAYADSDGDTFDGLATEIQLDTSDYKKWAHTSDVSPVKCKKYKTPNTVFYHYGTMKPWDNIIGATYRAMRIPTQEEEKGYKEARGFKTIHAENVNNSTIVSALQDEYIYQYTYVGHGGKGGQINPFGEGDTSAPAKRYTKYGIRYLVLNACWSAQSKYHDDPVDPLSKKYLYNQWEWNVAKRGWFIGYSDWMWIGNGALVWRATHGRNME